jgi:hypothetical protein
MVTQIGQIKRIFHGFFSSKTANFKRKSVKISRIRLIQCSNKAKAEIADSVYLGITT